MKHCLKYFENRSLLIASKHEKDRVMTPLFEKHLGVSCMVNQHFDTDILGTFTGEVERKHEPLSTLRMKCQKALELSDCDLVVGSEGSFGPHPSLFFVPANDELVMLIDKKNGFEIIERELSVETNFSGSHIDTEAELETFAEKACFPSHALILRPSQTNYATIYKGIDSWADLRMAFRKLKNDYDMVYAETDMRAMHNPKRMAVIETATKKLIEKIQSACPSCNAPGFGITRSLPGLPCSLCGLPTRSTLSHILSCSICQYETTRNYTNQKMHEDPMYCDVCNP